MSQVRLSAARVLLAVDAGRMTLAGALDRAHAAHSDSRDAALLVELTAGTLRWRNELDAIIARVGRRAVAGLDAPVRAVLRLGAYQIRHLDRVPPHAIVHDAVNDVRALGAGRAAGFVNAVLRSVARGAGTPALPPRPAEGAGAAAQAAYLTTSLSHPAWLVDRWTARYGFEAAMRWCEFNNTPPTLTIRSRGRWSVDQIAGRLAAEGLTAERSPYVLDTLRLPPGTLGRLPEDLRREVRVQDEGSQLVARVAGARPGEWVLDLCAAPGGKTMMLAEDLGGPGAPRSLLVASDHRSRRVALLSRLLRSAEVDVPILALDATRPLPFGPVFDCVLLDAPCSGIGTLRRDPDLKWSRTVEDLPALVRAEAAMMRQAAAAVAPGGRVVYATCSSEPEENGGVVEGFLAEDRRFALEPIINLPAELVTSEGYLATTPFGHGLDAFFTAVLVRQSGA